MKKLSLGSAVLALLLLASCQPKFDWPWLKDDAKKSSSVSGTSGDVTVAAFDSIRQEGLGTLVLDSTVPEGVVRITVKEKDRDAMTAEVNGSTLILKTKDGVHFNSGEAEYRVNPGQTLKSIVLKGMGDISSAQPWEGKEMLLQLEGLGKIGLALTVGQLTVRQQGAGEVTVSGTADSLEIEASGLGQVDAENLVAGSVKVKSSGVGEVLVNATEALDVTSSGLGAVHYKGNPKSKSLQSSGATSIDEIKS